jgi:predicted GIY-YIG superfamily endonuclease
MHQFIVYILHFEPSIKHAQHYCGITRTPLFERRMREHISGSGASLTRAAASQGSRFFVARTWSTDDAALEKRLKRSGHLRAHCIMCSTEPPLPGVMCREIKKPAGTIPSPAGVVEY